MGKTLWLGTVSISHFLVGWLIAQTASARPVEPTVNLEYRHPENGIEGSTNLRVRIPLTQDRGAFFFLEPTVGVSNGGNFLSSVVVGWRSLNEREKNIIGAFLAYDNRNFQGTFFNQFSAGLEYKAEGWGAYVYGFVPVGSRQGAGGLGKLLDQNFFDGTRYVFERRDRLTNSALGGLEIGADATIGIGQDYLRPGVGVYYLDSPISGGTVGVRGKLNYESSVINAGLSLQSDSIFGTTLSFKVGVSLTPVPRTPQAPDINNRLYEPVNKPTSIMVQNAPQGIADIVAINPDTNQPYAFYVVTNNPAGLPGTPVVEPPTPAGLTTALTNANNTGGNGVVYVYQANGALPAITGNFTVGDGTKLVSSSAPVTTFFGKSLPFIALRGVGGAPVDLDNFLVVNDGKALPVINGNLTLTAGNRQAVVGFDLNPTGRGIDGTNNSNPIILSNKISNAVDDGISLKNASGLTQV